MVSTRLAEQLERLTVFLRAHRHIWSPRPFVSQPVGWEAEHPEVSRWLRGLPDEQVDGLVSEPAALAQEPVAYQRWLSEAREVARVEPLKTAPLPVLAHPRLRWKIPRRKWIQVEAFCRAVAHSLPDHVERLVDWCAGKGHLGRTLGLVLGCPVTLIEHRPELCRAGERLAARVGVECRHVEADVLDPRAWDALGPDVAAVGLHPCGVLADTLLEQAVGREVAALFVATCCYHFVAGAERFEPRSRAARGLDLALSLHEIRLAIYDEVVAPQRDRRARRREMDFRAGFDLLVREAMGADRYVSPGPLPMGLFRQGFGDFCREAARRTGLPLPARWDEGAAERAGVERAGVARQLGVARAVFRRPLELWLVLDRALYLAEAGLEVTVGTFCPRTVTPRNLLIQALR